MENQEIEKEPQVVYEIGYLILPSIPEDKLSVVTDAMRKVISQEGGVEIDSEAPFKESLAYTVSKTINASRYVLSDAYIGWIKFEADKSKAQAIKAGIEKIEEVIRFLMVKAPRETHFTFAKAKAAAEEKGKLAKETDEDNEASPDLESVVE